MGRSNRLRLRDIDNVHQLTNECCEQWADPDAWRTHLADGTRNLINSVVSAVDHRQLPTMQPTAIVATGWPDESTRRTFLNGVRSVGPNGMPEYDKQMLRTQQRGQITFCVPTLLGEQGWRSCGLYKASFEPTRLDHLIVSFHQAPDTAKPSSNIITLNGQRLREDRAFTRREERLLALILSRVAPLVGTRLTTEAHVSTHGLTPRLRETLTLLLTGMSEKEVARTLHRSPKTIHQYVTILYRHFDVNSRAQLMAYFLARQPKPRGNGQP